MKANWEDTFNTGFDKVDSQHKYLLTLLNELSKAYYEGQTKSLISEILFKLEDYSYEHFEDEERILRSVEGLPSEKHKLEHANFMQMLRDLKFNYISDNAEITEELLDFLINWLSMHIYGIDQKELHLVNISKM